MKKHALFIFSLIFALCVSSTDSFAKPLHITVSPRNVSPGDVFAIKVTGGKTVTPTSASLKQKEFPFSSCGERCFIAVGAVDINAKPRAYTVTIKMEKRVKKIRLLVKRKKFPKLNLTLPEEKVSPDTEALNRIKSEDEKLATIFQTISERMWDGGFFSPMEHEVSTVFGTKRVMNGTWTSIHRGMDIRGKEGDDVMASNSGKVVLAEELFFGGNTIILDHGQGIYTIYMHLSKFNAQPGDTVSKGDVIGLVGSTGRATGPHLHFGAKVTGINVDPASLMKLKI
jgi:murein DD-endopeptidase MepM/ murein hydrolase activator NlpD